MRKITAFPAISGVLTAAVVAFFSMATMGQAQSNTGEQTIYSAPRAQSTVIDRWNVCRRVTGQESNPVMVPTRDQTEWVPFKSGSFLQSGAKGTSIQACMAAHPTPMSGGTPITTFCAIHPGQYVQYSMGYTSSGGYGSSGHNPAAVSRSGQFMLIKRISGISASMNGGNQGSVAVSYNSSKQCKDGACLLVTGYGSDRAISLIPTSGLPGNIDPSGTVFSPDGKQFISIGNGSTSYTRSFRTRHEYSSISADIYAIDQNTSSGAYSASYLTHFSIPASANTVYSFVKLGFGNRLFFHKRVVSYGTVWSNTLLEYTIQNGGYWLVNELTMPVNVDMVYVSDDGSAVFASDNGSKTSYTYTRDPNSGTYNLVQALGGYLAPSVMSPGGTVALGYQNATSAYCQRVRYGRDNYRMSCSGSNTPGRIAVYTKDLPDSPTWNKVSENNNFNYYIDYGFNGKLSPASSSGQFFPSISTDGKYLLAYKPTYYNQNGVTTGYYPAPKEIYLPNLSETAAAPAVGDFIPEMYMNVQQLYANQGGGGGNKAAWAEYLYYKCQ